MLTRLDDHALPGVPRLLGVDGRQREILTFLPGPTGHGLHDPGPELLRAVGAWTARFHDAMAGTPEAGSAETVCHRDLAPWNLVRLDGTASAPHRVGFIDWDDAAPGDRCTDVGYLLLTFLDLGSAERDDDRQRADIRLVTGSYAAESLDHDGLGDRLAAATVAEIDRILAFRRGQLDDPGPAVGSFAAARVAELEASRRWVERHPLIFGG